MIVCRPLDRGIEPRQDEDVLSVYCHKGTLLVWPPLTSRIAKGESGWSALCAMFCPKSGEGDRSKVSMTALMDGSCGCGIDCSQFRVRQAALENAEAFSGGGVLLCPSSDGRDWQ